VSLAKSNDDGRGNGGGCGGGGDHTDEEHYQWPQEEKEESKDKDNNFSNHCCFIVAETFCLQVGLLHRDFLHLVITSPSSFDVNQYIIVIINTGTSTTGRTDFPHGGDDDGNEQQQQQQHEPHPER